MGKILGYASIITADGQDVSSQKLVLERLGAIVVFTETILQGRDQLDAAIRLLDNGDTLVVLHPNQLARDTAEFFHIAERVIERNAVLKISDPDISIGGCDTNGASLPKVLGLVVLISKHFAQARQLRNIEIAKIRHTYKDCPELTDQNKVRQLRESGMKPAVIARELRISRERVYRALAITQ